MTVPVVFPDVTALLVDYLREVLDDRGMDAEVHQNVPANRPDWFLTVRRGGGIRQTIVSDAPIVLFEAWGPSLELAHDLAQIARAAVIAAQGTVIDGYPIYRVAEIGGPTDLPDPESGQARYVFSLQPHVRGFTEPDS